MKYLFFLIWVLPVLSGCIVVPQTDTARINKCEISSDRKTLKVINGFEDTNTFYSVSGLILLPISGVVSGTYVAINNVYHLGEETLVCDSEKHSSEYSLSGLEGEAGASTHKLLFKTR